MVNLAGSSKFFVPHGKRTGPNLSALTDSKRTFHFFYYCNSVAGLKYSAGSKGKIGCIVNI
jgi:hypothetical protein